MSSYEILIIPYSLIAYQPFPNASYADERALSSVTEVTNI